MQWDPIQPMDSRVSIWQIRSRQEQPLPLTAETLCQDARLWAAPKRYSKKCLHQYLKFAFDAKHFDCSLNQFLPDNRHLSFLFLFSFFQENCILDNNIVHSLFSCKLLSSRVINGWTYWESTIIACFSWMVTWKQRIYLFLCIHRKQQYLFCLQSFAGCSGIVSDFLCHSNSYFRREYGRLIDWQCSGIIRASRWGLQSSGQFFVTTNPTEKCACIDAWTN